RGNVGLEIGERQDKIGLQGEDLVDVRRREGAHARFLTASLWWPRNIAGDGEDAVLLTQQIQRLDGLFGEADNSVRREHQTLAYSISQTTAYQLLKARHATTSEAQ